MSYDRGNEMLDFLFEKEDCKDAEENLRTTLFSNVSQKTFKEELFSDELPVSWKAEPSEFNVDELLLESYFPNEKELTTSSTNGGHRFGPSSTGLIKEVDLDPFRDLASLPFEAVMSSLEGDMGGSFDMEVQDMQDTEVGDMTEGCSDYPEIGSDSGLSSDHPVSEVGLSDVLLSPSSRHFSRGLSPSSQTESMDTYDASSDISSTSSTSDLGSIADGSVSSQQSQLRGSVSPLRLGASASPQSMDRGFGSGKVGITNGSLSFLDHHEIRTKSVQARITNDSTTRPKIFTTVPSAINTKNIITTPQPLTTTKLSPTITHHTINTKSVKLGPHSQTPKIIKTSLAPTTFTTISPNSFTPTSTSSPNRPPILTKVRLDTSNIITQKVTSTKARTNNSPTIVVTQAGKANQILRNGTFLKAGNGRSILLPVNVGDLNQVRTIKIISAGSNTNTSRSTGVTTVRNLVTDVKPVSTTGTSIYTSGSSTPRTTFYTTSKGSDGRSLLKVTPTAYVSPQTHSSEISRVSVTPTYIKEEPSDGEEDYGHHNQELILNDEEKRLMKKEDIVLPSRYPLTKLEERDLKRIRRKIRNKISAQDSRKRKKEYVDGLEDRVKICSDENTQLQKRIKTLEKQNESLLAQMKKLQAIMGGAIYPNRNHNHASTALMMLILSAALFVVPSLRSQDTKAENELTRNTQIPSAGQSRSLLEVTSPVLPLDGFSTSDDVDMDSLVFSDPLSDHDYAPASKKPRMATPSNRFFAPPRIDKTLPRTDSEPPDSPGGFNAIAALIGGMLERLGTNWTDPGHSGNNVITGNKMLGTAFNRTPALGRQGRQNSVVVNLNAGGRIRDDIELE